MLLRPYQSEAVEATFDAWKEHQSTLALIPTGGGKTICFAEIIRRCLPKRTLVLCHREEILYQSARKIEALGIPTSIEMAEQTAGGSLWNRTPVVVSTVQTQCAGANGNGRMTHFKPDEFDYLICDEAHHFIAPSFKRVVDYYRQNHNLKVFGCTATPDRADEIALGQVFDNVSTEIEILDMIDDGWLVPVEQQFVTVDGLDYSHIRTTAGDLNLGDLSAVMEAEKTMQEIVASSIQIIGERKTLVFTASVKQAEVMADIFNRHRPEMAQWICGATPTKDRHERLARYVKGDTQVMVNCGIFGEGVDVPTIEVVVQSRPTKSRSLYAQQAGRSLRPLPGTVDGIDSAEDRKAAIAASAKPSAKIIDFVGNSGRHKLIYTADILGGKLSDEVIARATERAKAAGKPTRTDEEIAAAIAEIEEQKRKEAARKARLVGRATYRSVNVDPFHVFDIAPPRERGWDSGKVLSEKQRAVLLKQGIDPDSLPYPQAKALIGEFFRRWNNNLCTLKQAALLQKRGIDAREMTRDEASKRITIMAEREGWGNRTWKR